MTLFPENLYEVSKTEMSVNCTSRWAVLHRMLCNTAKNQEWAYGRNDIDRMVSFLEMVRR